MGVVQVVFEGPLHVRNLKCGRSHSDENFNVPRTHSKWMKLKYILSYELGQMVWNENLKSKEAIW